RRRRVGRAPCGQERRLIAPHLPILRPGPAPSNYGAGPEFVMLAAPTIPRGRARPTSAEGAIPPRNLSGTRTMRVRHSGATTSCATEGEVVLDVTSLLYPSCLTVPPCPSSTPPPRSWTVTSGF